jgi:hypothetical protein
MATAAVVFVREYPEVWAAISVVLVSLLVCNCEAYLCRRMAAQRADLSQLGPIQVYQKAFEQRQGLRTKKVDDYSLWRDPGKWHISEGSTVCWDEP